MSTAVSQYTKKDWIKIASCFVIPALFFLVPSTEVYTMGVKWFLAATV